MLHKKNQILTAVHKKPILYDLYQGDSKKAKHLVIFCHGYKGFKDWGAWHLVAEALAKEEFLFLKFNFSHNGGTVENPIDFPDLEAFAQNNFSKELDDLDRVLDFVTRELHPESISVVAHSRGSGIALIKAEEDLRIHRVITWAGVCNYKMLFKEGSEAFQKWKNTGRSYVENTRTRQQMPHDWQFYEDFKENEERLTIERAVKKLRKPQLILHGSDDATIPAEMAQLLHNWNPKSKLIIIEGADHVFGASHPWPHDHTPKDLQKAIDLTLAFLK
jgi:pimeloyl-ACP methyl ester carboxylesterase